MVECEYRNSDCGNQIFIVLIDTWWNVNGGYYCLGVCRDTRFNRYMVECECICPFCSVNLIIVLIDTWWNVNT